MNSPPPTPSRSGTVVIVGRANTGKSSLLNAFLGETVSIASPVAQTTRRPIRGILTQQDVQIVFLDTPGIRRASHALSALLNRSARAQVAGADVLLLVLDASVPPREEDLGWMHKLAREHVTLFAVLNKVDLGCRRAAYEAAWQTTLQELRTRDETFPPPHVRWFEISARTGAGLQELLAALRAAMPKAPPLFPPDLLTDDPRPFFLADVIRAHLNAILRDELPHAVAVAVEQIEETETAVNVHAAIYVEKASQRPILLGHRGRRLRAVRRAAEQDLTAIYEKPHHLTLWVKVEPNWAKNYWLLKKFGYLPG